MLLPKSEENIPIKERQKLSNERTKHENHKKRLQMKEQKKMTSNWRIASTSRPLKLLKVYISERKEHRNHMTDLKLRKDVFVKFKDAFNNKEINIMGTAFSNYGNESWNFRNVFKIIDKSARFSQ